MIESLIDKLVNILNIHHFLSCVMSKHVKILLTLMT